jgi:hypothetical protein
MMNIVLLSFSGNAGKTTLARNLFAPRLPGATLVSVESINADGKEDVTLRGKQFTELLDAVALSEGVVVDVGASNVEDWLQRLQQTRRSHQLFDAFVVPTMPGAKQTRDAIATIEALAQIGVPADKVKVILNGMEATDTESTAFAPLIAYLNDTGRGRLIAGHISDNEIYGRLAAMGKTIDQVLSDGYETLEQARLAAKTPQERLDATRAIALHGMAESAQEELEVAWEGLANS